MYKNILDSSDEIVVNNGQVTIQLTNGEPKIYRASAEESGGAERSHRGQIKHQTISAYFDALCLSGYRKGINWQLLFPLCVE